MRRIKPLLWLLAFMCLPSALLAQAVRYDSNVYTINSSAPQPGGLYPVLAYPGATVQICNYSTSSACPSLATTYTDATGTTACATSTQLTPSNSPVCTAYADTQGGFGVWIAVGNYQFNVTTAYGTYGPYDFSIGAGSAGAIYPSTPGLATCTGTPCVAWANSFNTSTNPLPIDYLAPSGTNGQILSTQGGVPTWIAPGGSTSPGGSVAYVELTGPGSYTTCPTTVTFSGGGTPSVPAVASVYCSNEGDIPVPTAIILSDAGYGYTSTPSVAISGGVGSGATAVAEMGSFVIALNTPTVPGTGPDPSLEGGILTIPYYPNVVYTINGVGGAFTFTGAGVTCSSTTCNFTGGSSFITSLTTTGTSGPATVTSGVLNIPQYSGGGFTNPMTTLGDLIYGGSSGTATRLAGNTTTSALYLCQTGTGSASAAPSWCSITSGATLQTNGTNNTSQSLLNFTDTSTVKASNPSGGVQSFTVPTATATQLGVSSPDNSTVTATSGVYTVANTTLNGTAMTPGGSYQLTPPTTYQFVQAATAIGGIAYAAGLSYYDNNAPSLVAYSTGQSTVAALAALLTSAGSSSTYEYMQGSMAYPAYWTHTDAYVTFSMDTATSGSVTFTIQSACVGAGSTLGSEGWSTGVAVTTTVPGTVGNAAETAIFSDIGEPGLGGCPSSPTAPGQLQYRIALTGTTASGGNVLVEGLTFATGRSQ